MISARYARAYIDVNREPYELDPAMFDDELPDFARRRTARVAAGLGSIARVVAEGQEIYDRKLTFAEAAARIETVHAPYHAALAGLMDEARAAHGYAVLVDWHSMPSAAVEADARLRSAPARRARRPLRRRLRAAADDGARGRADRARPGDGAQHALRRRLHHRGLRPAGQGLHAIQVEMNRALYLRRGDDDPQRRFRSLADALERLFGRLAAMDWSALRPPR